MCIQQLLAFQAKYDLIMVEDTCESLGTKAVVSEGGSSCSYLGTFGDFGTYSFYFSHHITTGEGARLRMIITTSVASERTNAIQSHSKLTNKLKLIEHCRDSSTLTRNPRVRVSLACTAALENALVDCHLAWSGRTAKRLPKLPMTRKQNNLLRFSKKI